MRTLGFWHLKCDCCPHRCGSQVQLQPAEDRTSGHRHRVPPQGGTHFVQRPVRVVPPRHHQERRSRRSGAAAESLGLLESLLQLLKDAADALRPRRFGKRSMQKKERKLKTAPLREGRAKWAFIEAGDEDIELGDVPLTGPSGGPNG